MDKTPPIWDILKENLKSKVSVVNYNNWFRPISDAQIDGDILVVSVPNRFYADWLTDFYSETLEQEGSALAQKPIKIRFQIVGERSVTDRPVAEPVTDRSVTDRKKTGQNGRPAAGRTADQPLTARPPVQVKVSPSLNPKYTFENFVVGSGNQLAHAAAKAVADLPGSHYNPLFLYGGVGLGKTHLLHAIGIEAQRRQPGFRIISLSAEKFMNEYINSVRNNQMEAFRKKYRTTCDMLLIDDIQFLGGKESTQQEFFHTFNELHNSHRQIVVTSDKIPKEIPGLDERLLSRFEWGLVADIQPPDFETRVAILRKKADRDKIYLSDEVAMYLAQNIQSNVRELEGALIRLNAFAALSSGRITLDLTKEVIKNHLRPEVDSDRSPTGQRRSNVESIQKTVADFYQIELSALKSPRRLKSLAHPRQIAMYLCKKHLKLSYPELGHRFGGKDHTTVIHACRKIERLLESDPNLQNDIAILEKTIV